MISSFDVMLTSSPSPISSLLYSSTNESLFDNNYNIHIAFAQEGGDDGGGDELENYFIFLVLLEYSQNIFYIAVKNPYPINLVNS